MTIYIIKVDTRHGTDSILVTTKPTDMDMGLIENYYLKAYDLENVHVEYYESMPVDEIPESALQWVARQREQDRDRP